MSTTEEALNAMSAGISAADGPEKTKEVADVKLWFKRLDAARKHDEPARKQYVRDRKLARGDTHAEVSANVLGTNIDILEAFLYARDPEVDVMPATACDPPDPDTIKDAVPDLVKQDQTVQKAAQAAGAQAQIESLKKLAGGALPQLAAQAGIQLPPDPSLAGEPAPPPVMDGPPSDPASGASQDVIDQAEKAKFTEISDQYAKRQRDMKAYAQTLEIVITHLWKTGGLKRAGRRQVRSGLTIGVGVLKVSWQERTAPSPETVTAINDLQAQIQRVVAMKAELDDPTTAGDLEAKKAEYERSLAAAQSQAEVVLERGLCIDVVQGEDFQIPMGFTLADHLNAPWNAFRTAKLVADCKAEFGLSDEQAKQGTRYQPREPVMRDEVSGAEPGTEVDVKDADAYKPASGSDDSETFFMVWEFWDRNSNSVLTGIEGVKTWVKPPWTPTATTRFYPGFLYTTSEIDGQRHPQSLVSRSAKLVDEYNRIGSAEAEHRRRVMPGVFFDEGQIEAENMKKITGSLIQEFVGIKPINPQKPIGELFKEKPYAGLDAALYDRTRIKTELDSIWGIQEALAGGMNSVPTATEAKIQQTGFQARTNARRDLLELELQDLAQYTAEISRAHLSEEDVVALAGPNALWPPYQGAADLAGMVEVEIRAGSSGKPDTQAEREAWSAEEPIFQAAINELGTLRNSAPEDVAAAKIELMRITARRSGDKIDVDAIVPKAGPPATPPSPPIKDLALDGSQTQSLTAILADVAAKKIPEQAAVIAVQLAYPHFDPAQVQAMFAPLRNFTPAVDPAVAVKLNGTIPGKDAPEPLGEPAPAAPVMQ